jgi:NAD(P)-dependent dehydrogenase (short-subunit alcohol dehydrogenase family)
VSDADLAGRVAIVAGATGTIGRAVCADLAARGATIAVLYRSRSDDAAALAAGLPSRALAVPVDLASDASLDAALIAVERELGAPGVLVNTVHAESSIVRVADLSRADLDVQFASVTAHAALVSRVLPAMREGAWGRIVYVSGALMARPHPGFAAYGAAKAAASVLTRYLALEEGRAGITANIVAPGRVVDPADAEALDPERASLSARLLERTALGAFPTPAEVARAVGDLAGAGAITGQTVWVTGGEPIAA